MRFHSRQYFGPYANTYVIVIFDQGKGSLKFFRRLPGQVTLKDVYHSDCMFKLSAQKCGIVDVFKQTVVDEEGNDVDYLYFDVELHGSRMPIPEVGAGDLELGGKADSGIAELADAPPLEEKANGTVPVECSKDCRLGPNSIPCPDDTHPECDGNRLVCEEGEG